MMTTATTTDHIRWQQRALREMTAVIDNGAKARLEPLMWQLGGSGSAGVVSTLGLSLAEQESRLRAWADLCGWPVTEHRKDDGTLFLLTAAEPVTEPWMLPSIVLKVSLCDWDAGDAQ
jgi:hypothetical protein